MEEKRHVYGTWSQILCPCCPSIWRPHREEDGLDPNRDFPYRQRPNQCMTTITVRTSSRTSKVREHTWASVGRREGRGALACPAARSRVGFSTRAFFFQKSRQARALNELWREHLFQLALTFHGGMESITYEWGSFNHPRGKDKSPDDTAQHQITEGGAGRMDVRTCIGLRPDPDREP